MRCFTLSTFLRNDWTVELEQIIFGYNLYTIFFLLLLAKLLYYDYNHQMMLLLISLRIRVLLSFLLRLSWYHPGMFTSPLQRTLKQQNHFSYNYFSIPKNTEILSIQMLFKDVLLETEYSEVILIWWFVSIKCITSFSKFSFF